MPQQKEIRQLQQVELKILHKALDICKELNLRVFAVSGTCLGAVKYNGFIPWDDDVDIALPRKDYEIFIREAAKYLPPHLFLQTHKTDPHYYAQFAKIRDSRTTFVETSACKLDINHGVYIDIFPLDGYPKTKLQKRLFHIKKRIYTLRISKKYYSKKRSWRWRVMSALSVILVPSVESAWQKREALYSKIDFDGAKTIGNFANAWEKKEITQKSYFESAVLEKFEDLEMPIPVGYKEYLHKLYGDISKDPPVADQVPHHYALMIDLDRSYIDNGEIIKAKVSEEVNK